jgi:hypothetical protein
MPGAGPQRDMRLAMANQDNAHGGNMLGQAQTESFQHSMKCKLQMAPFRNC